VSWRPVVRATCARDDGREIARRRAAGAGRFVSISIGVAARDETGGFHFLRVFGSDRGRRFASVARFLGSAAFQWENKQWRTAPTEGGDWARVTCPGVSHLRGF